MGLERLKIAVPNDTSGGAAIGIHAGYENTVKWLVRDDEGLRSGTSFSQ